MKALFDTNILIDYLKGIEPAQAELARYRQPLISIVTWMEILAGVRNEEEGDVVEMFLRDFRVVEVTRAITRSVSAVPSEPSAVKSSTVSRGIGAPKSGGSTWHVAHFAMTASTAQGSALEVSFVSVVSVSVSLHPTAESPKRSVTHARLCIGLGFARVVPPVMLGPSCAARAEGALTGESTCHVSSSGRYCAPTPE